MSLMVSVSGIRGIFGEDLNPENIARFSAAYGTWAKGGKIVIGRDSRVTGELCEQIVTASLQSVGCDVILLGIVPTPTVAMGVLKHKAAGGIVISASHNPAQWNALKLLNSKSEFLDSDQGKKVMEIAENSKAAYVSYDKIGSISIDPDIIHDHIQKILDLPYIDTDVIRKAGFRVALDAVNGAGSESMPLLLGHLGVKETIKIHCTPNGIFPHNPEPLPEHLGDICELVKKTGADIGFVTDPDADRLAIVDNLGELFGEEYTLAATLDLHLSRNKGPVVVNLSSSRISEDIASKYGQKCHRSAVGEINVVKKMQETGAVSGGEGNGGVINPDLHYGRDALVGVAMVLQLLAERNIDARTYRRSLPDYFIVKSKVDLKNVDADTVLESVKNSYQNERVNTIDGVKIDFADGWVHLRKSNTEPIIRIYSESTSIQRAKEIAAPIMKLIQTI